MNERRLAALKQDSSESESDDGAGTSRSLAGIHCVPIVSEDLHIKRIIVPFIFCHLPDGSTSERSASVVQVISVQSRNYYTSVSENKEIVKLASVLSSSISSIKKVNLI